MYDQQIVEKVKRWVNQREEAEQFLSKDVRLYVQNAALSGSDPAQGVVLIKKITDWSTKTAEAF